MKFSIVAVNVENLPPDVVGIEGENCRGTMRMAMVRLDELSGFIGGIA